MSDFMKSYKKAHKQSLSETQRLVNQGASLNRVVMENFISAMDQMAGFIGMLDPEKVELVDHVKAVKQGLEKMLGIL
jgi:uncharacterized protein YjgD (DUF1641 family)